jgi:hypothetical protein
MRIRIKAMPSRLLVMSGALLYTWLLEWSYSNIVSPAYMYDGFGDNPAATGYRVAGALIGLIPSLWMPVSIVRPTQIVYWLLYGAVVIPTCIVPFHARATDPSGLIWFCLCVVACMGLLEMVYHVPLLRIPRMRLTRRAYTGVILAFSGIFYAFVISRFGFHFQLVALDSIYDVRGDYAQALAGTSSLVAYSLGWQGNVMNMLLMAMGLVRRNVLFLAAGLSGQLFLFSITGFKSLLFSGLLCLLVYAVIHHRGRYAGLSILWGLVGMICLTLGLRTLVPDSSTAVTLLSVFLQRTLAMPGLLSGQFYEFYSNNPPAYLGYSIFRSFVHYPYGLEPARLLGQLYFGNPDTSANAHIWADAYCNFRTPGLFVFTGVLAVFLWVYDSCARGRDKAITTIFLAIPALSLCNSGLLTTLLTHGLGLALLMVYLMPAIPASQEEPSVRRRNRLLAGASAPPDAGLAGAS